MGLLDQVRQRTIGQVTAKLTGSSRSVFEVVAAVNSKASSVQQTVMQVASMPRSVISTATGMANGVIQNVKAIANLPQAVATELSSAANLLASSVSSMVGSVGLGGSSSTNRPRGNQTFNALTAARGREDPMLNVDWYCELPTISGAEGTYSLGWEMVEEATIPLIEFEPISNYIAGKMHHYPSHQNLAPISLNLYEDSTGQVTNYFRRWQGLILDSDTGLYNVPAVYKQTIKITLLDVTKAEVLIFTYLGCWPTRIDSYRLVSGQAERVIPVVELSVDDMKVSVVSLASGQAGSLLYNNGTEFPGNLANLDSVYPSSVGSGVMSSLLS